MSFYESVARKGLNSVYDPLIIQAAQQYGVEVALIKGIISKESSWNPTVASSSSYGLMQLNAAYFHNPDGSPILDPASNIEIGTSLISSQIQKRASIEVALAGYNAGTSRSDEDLQTRISQNVLGVGSYVQDVLAYRQWFLANDPASGGTSPPSDGGIVEITDSDIKWIAGVVVLVGIFWVLMRR